MFYIVYHGICGYTRQIWHILTRISTFLSLCWMIFHFELKRTGCSAMRKERELCENLKQIWIGHRPHKNDSDWKGLCVFFFHNFSIETESAVNYGVARFEETGFWVNCSENFSLIELKGFFHPLENAVFSLRSMFDTVVQLHWHQFASSNP